MYPGDTKSSVKLDTCSVVGITEFRFMSKMVLLVMDTKVLSVVVPKSDEFLIKLASSYVNLNCTTALSSDSISPIPRVMDILGICPLYKVISVRFSSRILTVSEKYNVTTSLLVLKSNAVNSGEVLSSV